MDDVLALLCLQIEWGADEAIDRDPVDRLRPIGTQAPVVQRLPEAVADTPIGRARMLAAHAASLDQLRAAVANFDGCALRDTASNMVFAAGNPFSTTLIIGEPPGREEDRTGQPFAGLEGQMLDEMLASIGLIRTDLMLASLLPWRPPGGRPASAAEILICEPFLHRLITLISPRQIVLFGTSAARAMLPQLQNRRRLPQGWIETRVPDLHVNPPALALPGLADMLRNPPLRRDAWSGLRLLRRALDTA